MNDEMIFRTYEEFVKNEKEVEFHLNEYVLGLVVDAEMTPHSFLKNFDTCINIAKIMLKNKKVPKGKIAFDCSLKKSASMLVSGTRNMTGHEKGEFLVEQYQRFRNMFAEANIKLNGRSFEEFLKKENQELEEFKEIYPVCVDRAYDLVKNPMQEYQSIATLRKKIKEDITNFCKQYSIVNPDEIRLSWCTSYVQSEDGYGGEDTVCYKITASRMPTEQEHLKRVKQEYNKLVGNYNWAVSRLVKNNEKGKFFLKNSF